MLVATPLNCTDIDSFAAELLRMFRYMSGIGFKINDMNTMGLVLEPLDPQEEPEPLQVQLERLPCSMEARWEILRVLTEFETYLRELTELLRPVAEQLAAEMQALTERNRAQLAIWEKYFQTHSVDTFQQEMFRASYLFTQEMQPDEVWIALWNFNMVGFWTEWFESGGKTVRIAYLGANLSFEFAAAHQVRPDAETLCAMMRALTGKDKLEILRGADAIFREELAEAGLSRKVHQYFAVLTNNRSVGVMGDFRTYDYTLALRGVTTTDFMTADWARIPYEVLEKVSSRIINEVDHINRIVYDITSKPPATIEWE